MDQHEIERKWQKAWAEQKAFQPEVNSQKKFMATFPYPYVNGLPHVGHLFTNMRVEALCRYKRAQGYNVLFPQGWHCTGSPIVNAAKRVAENDEKQIQILLDLGVPEKEIPKFKEPVHWIDYFVPRYRQDIQALGVSVDWRREFITTSLNPRYDKFIRWQFRKLKEKDYVAIGKKPVVWCPKEHCPVSDHSRLSGEGETPQEFVLILFELENHDYVACATLRPETYEGITNIWINPAIDYVRIAIDGMHWIVSRQCADKLREQEHEVKVLGEVPGKSLVGKQAKGPTGLPVPLLPATFPTADKGTGIVMSVPSDAPDDYVALRDLQHNKKLIEEYRLQGIEHIKVIPIIDAGELGHMAAVKVVEDMKIQNQKERDKLEAAKKLVYKKGYYEGVMLGGDYKGEKVEVAKEKIKQAMLATKQAYAFYELTGPVVCRCLTPAVVKIVSNQWFITYSDQEWKKQAHKALDQMKLYPERSRQQFEYVIDWLNDWACTREEGLGTRLPWDEHWLIESLSDSTFYNTYYTFVHKLKDIPEEHITDELFDYVIQGKGKGKAEWEPLRKEFDYWYPVDFRNSGKDLIQNHLTFMLFTHAALLPPEKWPRSYGVNGWVTVNGQKMSKSLGNVIPVRVMLEQFGADASRLTILNGGEGMDDPNWDTELARATKTRLASNYELWTSYYNKGRSNHQPLDDWFASKLHSTIKSTTDAMELTQFRTALQYSWFELGNTIKQYLKLTGNEPNRQLMNEAIEAQLRLLQPFTPHICEEAWQAIGKNGFVSHAAWPQYDESKIRPELESRQAIIEQLTSDIRAVQQLTKMEKLSEVVIIVSPQWKYGLYRQVREALEESRDVREVLKRVSVDKQHTGDMMKLVPMLVKDPSKLPSSDTKQEDELHSIESASDYLQKTFSCNITVQRAEDSSEAKAKSAAPGKPAILLK